MLFPVVTEKEVKQGSYQKKKKNNNNTTSKLYKQLKFAQNETQEKEKKAKAMTTFDPHATVTDVELLSLQVLSWSNLT